MKNILETMGFLEFSGDEIKKKIEFVEGKNIIGRNQTTCNIFVDHP